MQKFIDGLEKKEDESELSRGVHLKLMEIERGEKRVIPQINPNNRCFCFMAYWPPATTTEES